MTTITMKPQDVYDAADKTIESIRKERSEKVSKEALKIQGGWFNRNIARQTLEQITRSVSKEHRFADLYRPQERVAVCLARAAAYLISLREERMMSVDINSFGMIALRLPEGKGGGSGHLMKDVAPKEPA